MRLFKFGLFRRKRREFKEYYTKEEILSITQKKLENPKIKKNMKIVFWVAIGLIFILLIFNNITIHEGKIKYKYHWVK